MIAVEEVVRMDKVPLPGMPDPDGYYDPERIAGWLENWDQLNELAMLTPPSTTNYEDLPIHGKGYKVTDRMRYLHVLADLQIAWVKLDGMEYEAVRMVIWGESFRQAEHDKGVRHGTYGAAYRRACCHMAEHLGWRER